MSLTLVLLNIYIYIRSRDIVPLSLFTTHKGGSNETLDNLEQECGTYFQFFLRPPLTVR